jgi:hypothetical protein
MPETISEQDFERGALSFLEANAEPRVETRQSWGEGSDQVSILPERTLEEEIAELTEARAWAQKRFDAGFSWITGPVEYGGRGLSRDFQRAYNALEGALRHPPMSAYGIGLGMVAPTILAHATDEVKKRYLQPCGGATSWPASSSVSRERERPGQPADQGGARRRGVDRDRPEGVDVGRPPVGDRRDHVPDEPRRAQAQGTDGFRRRHACARGGDPTPAADDGRGLVQRGLLQRGPDPRLAPAGRRERGMDGGPDDPDERAGGHRRGDGQRGAGTWARSV